MDSQLFFLLPVLLIGGIFSTVAGGGLSLILIIFSSLILDIRSAIILNGYIIIINQFSKAFLFHRFAQFKIVLSLAALGIPCSYIGSKYLFLLPIDTIRIIVSVLLIVFVTLRMFRFIPNIQETMPQLLVIGALTGFLDGLAGVGSFVQKSYLILAGLRKESFLGTTSLLLLIIGIPKMIIYIPETQWSNEYIVFLILSVIMIFSGASIGKRILSKVSGVLFERLLLITIFIGALRLLLV